MDKELLNKLQSYSLLAGSVAVTASAAGQIEYTDINPDQVFTGSGVYNLDLNNDATTDFQLNVSTSVSVTTSGSWFSNYVYITPQGGNQVAGSGSFGSTWNYPYALNLNAVIDPNQNWINGATSKSALFSYFSSSSTYGNWGGQNNKYLGLRVTVGTDTIYGWARLDVNINASSFTIKDYSYQSCPGIPILAGDSSTKNAPIATAVTGADVANNGNGLDLQIGFTIPGSEVGIKEYRILVVDSAKAGAFTVDSAKAVASGNYTVHKPNGSNYSSVLTAASKDTDGNLITNNKPYAIFVLSIPDGTTSNSPFMSAPSKEVTLKVPVGIERDLDPNALKAYTVDGKILMEVGSDLIGGSYSLRDTQGRIIASGKVAGFREIVNVGGLTEGVYIVTLTHHQGDNKVSKVYIR